MKRVFENDLTEWFHSHDRKPLILRGARQVGKSTLVHLFAKNNSYDLIEINLETYKFKALEKEVFSIEDWLLEIEAIGQKTITKNTIIFLDEIQAQPKAIAMLRYFYEKRPDIPVLAAGSLLEIVLHNEEVSFPVGRVSFLWISPMSFGEYLMAIGKEDLYHLILENRLSEYHAPIVSEELKKYFFIGGMPNVVKTFIETQSLLEARKIQQEIIETYVSDFPKYSKRINVERMVTVFKQLPFFLGKKLIYQHLDSGSKSIEIKKCVELLIRANIIVPSFHSNASGVPLAATLDRSITKMFFLDIGLVNAIHQFEWNDFQEMYDKSFVTKGFLAEQFISQHLSGAISKISPPETIFWLRDKSTKKAEVDFLVTKNSEILPVEVKASKGKKLASLIIFAKEKKLKKAIKFSKEWFFEEKIQVGDSRELLVENWPLYCVEGFVKTLVKG